MCKYESYFKTTTVERVLKTNDMYGEAIAKRKFGRFLVTNYEFQKYYL